MDNGDHGESEKEIRTETSPEVPEPTQGDLSDDDNYEQTQQDIAHVKIAELRLWDRCCNNQTELRSSTFLFRLQQTMKSRFVWTSVCRWS
jgi:hypothetical protein